MNIFIEKDPAALGVAAGKRAAGLIRKALQEKGFANIILATGTSQFETLNQLIAEKNIDWGRVIMFHLDEYIHLPASHPASFRKYLRERFLDKVPPLKAAYLISGEGDPAEECQRLGELIRKHPIDVALVGIGENGHLAFNDPPADFDTDAPYIIAHLDEQCRLQQMNEGWFASIDAVPQRAISMSVKQIMLSAQIICSVPDRRKAIAVRDCLTGSISNLHPASILRNHPACELYLDTESAALIKGVTSSN